MSKFPVSKSQAPQVPTEKESQSIINESSTPPNEHETKLAMDVTNNDPARENLVDMLTRPIEDTQPVISTEVDESFGPYPSQAADLDIEEALAIKAEGREEEEIRSVRKSKVKLNAELIDENWLGRGVIQAKPLTMPEMLNVKPRDPNTMFRWVQYKCEEGSRVLRHQAMGFEIATKEDIDGNIPIEVKQGSIGITCYDVVLMKIDKLRLLGAYEYNLQRSQRMVSRKGSHNKALEAAVAQLKADMTANNTPSEYIKGRVSYFMPTTEIAEARTR